MATPSYPSYNPTTAVAGSADEELRNAYGSLSQIQRLIDSTSRGSKNYNTYLTTYNAIKTNISDLQQQIDKRNQTEKGTQQTSKRAKLAEDLAKAKDLQNPDQIAKAQQALENFDSANPQAKPAQPLRYGPNGESLVPGTPAYEQGATTAPTGAAANKPFDGAFKTTVPQTTTGAKTTIATGGKGDKTTTPAGTDVKGLWISYLGKTFSTLTGPDKVQIDALFKQAKTGAWTEANFLEALKGTRWWQTTLPSMAQFFIESHDPRNAATFAEKLRNNIDSTNAALEKLGIAVNTIDPTTGKIIDNTSKIQGIAMDKMQNGWDENQFAHHLATNADIIFTGGGAIGSYVDTLKKTALNYGVNLDKNYLDTINHDLLDQTSGRDSQWYVNEIKNQAMDAYKPFAPQLQQGRSLYEVTNSYRNQMASLLEVDPADISWKDLMGKVMRPDGSAANTFADFTKSVKQDPLWQTTKNAKETYSNMANDLLKQFGFLG